MNKPIARIRGLVVRRLGEETVVYDVESHRAHCLNRTAALVFRHADGRRSLASIAAAVAEATHSAVDEGIVRSAIAQLAEANLIEDASISTPESPSRREALRVGLGLAALAPAVLSLVVPTPAEAAATCIPKASCTLAKYGTPCYDASTAECSSKICLDNGVCG